MVAMIESAAARLILTMERDEFPAWMAWGIIPFEKPIDLWRSQNLRRAESSSCPLTAKSASHQCATSCQLISFDLGIEARLDPN